MPVLAAFFACSAAPQPVAPSDTRDPIYLLNHGRVEEAENLLLDVLRKDPGNSHAHALLGEIAFNRKQYAAAVAQFEKARSLVAGSPRATVNFAEALLRTQKPESAEQLLAALPARNAEAQFQAGLLLAGFERFAEAEKHFLIARPGYRAQDILAYNLALAQYRSRKFSECADTLENARKLGFHDGDILNLQGQCYLDAARPQEALQTLKLAIQQNPKDERNYVTVARLAIDEDMAMAGLEIVDSGLRLMPESQTLLLQRGYLQLSQGQYPESESAYRKALALKPGSISAQIGLAFVLLENQQLPEAKDLLTRLAERQPSNSFLQYLLGELHIRQDSGDEAIQHLEKSASLEPRFAAVHTDLGKLYLKKNDVARAIQELETSLRLDPDDSTAYYQLSMAYRKSGQPQKAQEALVAVRRLNKEKSALGTARFLTQRFRKARDQALAPF